jgi:mevalonate kinase
MRLARNAVRAVQGAASGADVAACVFGGMVSYLPQPLTAEKLPDIHPLTAIYSGFKTPTPEAIKRVQQTFAPHASVFRHLMSAIGQCALEGTLYAKKSNWTQLGAVMDVQQGLMDALGVNMPIMHDIVLKLRQQPTVLGAKISGAGLGDCIVGLGGLPNNDVFATADNQVQNIPVQMTSQGVQCEKN